MIHVQLYLWHLEKWRRILITPVAFTVLVNQQTHPGAYLKHVTEEPHEAHSFWLQKNRHSLLYWLMLIQTGLYKSLYIKFNHSIHILNIWYHLNILLCLSFTWLEASVDFFTGWWKMDYSILTGHWCCICQLKWILITFIIHKQLT